MFLLKSYVSILLIFFLALSMIRIGASQDAEPFLLDIEELQEKKRQFREGTAGAELKKEIRQTIRHADNAFGKGPWSVTDKEQVPPSGDKHDFLDQAGYWWPDPDQPDGLPYIRRDGETNPNRVTDFRGMKRMTENVRLLSVAWYYTGKEEYADYATELLQVWFLDKETKMNPNLNFAAIIPGRNKLRGTGLIGTRLFLDMLEGVQLLTGSQAWSEDEHKALREWFREYLDWMQNSKVGRKGEKQPNNIGTAYDMQRVYYALFIGNEELARRVLTESVPERIEDQFKEDGSQPYELRRTRSWTYSLANLNSWFNLARLAEHVGIDLWNYETSSGKSIKKAFLFLRPYAYGEKEWEYEQIRDINMRTSYRNLEKKAPLFYTKNRDQM